MCAPQWCTARNLLPQGGLSLVLEGARLPGAQAGHLLPRQLLDGLHRQLLQAVGARSLDQRPGEPQSSDDHHCRVLRAGNPGVPSNHARWVRPVSRSENVLLSLLITMLRRRGPSACRCSTLAGGTCSADARWPSFASTSRSTRLTCKRFPMVRTRRARVRVHVLWGLRKTFPTETKVQ